jgi:hypothetical protein
MPKSEPLTYFDFPLKELQTDMAQWKPFSPIYRLEGVTVQVGIPTRFIISKNPLTLEPEGAAYVMAQLAMITAKAQDLYEEGRLGK